MANEQSQKRGGGYQIDEITYAKGGSTLNAYICPQGVIKESVTRSARTKWMTPNKCHGIIFMHWPGQVP